MNDFDFVALDFETANDNRYSACQLAMIGVKDGRVQETFSEYIRPPERLFKFTHIHGISYGDVEYQRSFKELYLEIDNFISRTDHLVAHNMPFDRDVFARCCDYYGILKPVHQWNCTVQIARKVWPKSTEMPNHKLDTVCARFGIQLNHHEALSDTNAVVEIISKAQKYGWKPPWGDKAPSVKTTKTKIQSNTAATKSREEKAAAWSNKIIAERNRDGYQIGAPYKLFGDAGLLEGVIVKGLAYGTCVFEAHGGDSYRGDFASGLPHGKGVYEWANGDKYEGEWLNGKRTHGIWETDDGERYEGQFQEGRFHGFGTWTYENEIYRGKFKENLRHGYGRYAKGITFPSSHKDCDDLYEGEEIRVYSAGSFLLEGTWEDDVPDYDVVGTSYKEAGVAVSDDGDWKWVRGGRDFIQHEGVMPGGRQQGSGTERMYILADEDTYWLGGGNLHCVYKGYFGKNGRHGRGQLFYTDKKTGNAVYCQGAWEDGALAQIVRLEICEPESYYYLDSPADDYRHRIYLESDGTFWVEEGPEGYDLTELQKNSEFLSIKKYKFETEFVKGKAVGVVTTKDSTGETEAKGVFVLSDILSSVAGSRHFLPR